MVATSMNVPVAADVSPLAYRVVAYMSVGDGQYTTCVLLPGMDVDPDMTVVGGDEDLGAALTLATRMRASYRA